MDENKSHIRAADLAVDASRFLAPSLIDKAANEEAALPVPVMICLQRRYEGNELCEEEVWRGERRKGDKVKRRRRHTLKQMSRKSLFVDGRHSRPGMEPC